MFFASYYPFEVMVEIDCSGGEGGIPSPPSFHLGCSPSRTRYNPRALYSSRSNSPKPATLTAIRYAHFSSAGSIRVGFVSHVLSFPLTPSLSPQERGRRATSDQQRATNSWRTRLQPIRTFGEITAHIKILPAHQPYLYQKLSQKATQLRLLGMTYQQIAKSLKVNKRTAIRACKYGRR